MSSSEPKDEASCSTLTRFRARSSSKGHGEGEDGACVAVVVNDGRGREYERVKMGASLRCGVELDDEADAAGDELSGSGWRMRSEPGILCRCPGTVETKGKEEQPDQAQART